MRIDYLANELKKSYSGAADREQVVQIHLFGIRFADEIQGKSCQEIAIRAGIGKSYGTEIRKGVNLAKYVTINK